MGNRAERDEALSEAISLARVFIEHGELALKRDRRFSKEADTACVTGTQLTQAIRDFKFEQNM